MTCGCGEWYCVGKLFYIFERVAACCALAAVVSCIIFTITTSVGLGVGIGYNYCLVEKKTGEATKPPTDEVDGRRGAKSLKTKAQTKPVVNNTTFNAYKFRSKSELKPSMRTLVWRKDVNTNTKRVDETLHADHERYLEAIHSPPHPQPPNTVLIVPLMSQSNISSIVSKILSRNENVTVQFINM
ncbi:hypothetical protein evm_004461 [Chilo suppressalis]|nr:hypothetical protein evm_004461 [Chilo suppressalis]